MQHVMELESYLGGEIPGVGMNGDSEGEARVGMTWKEERESLCTTVRVSSVQLMYFLLVD